MGETGPQEPKEQDMNTTLRNAEAEDAEADAITIERDLVRGTEYESRYADAQNYGLRYVMQILALAACGDEDAIKDLAELDAAAQG